MRQGTYYVFFYSFRQGNGGLIILNFFGGVGVFVLSTQFSFFNGIGGVRGCGYSRLYGRR